MNKILLFLFVPIGFLLTGHSQTNPSHYYLITEAGDTLPTGTPIPIKAKKIDPTSVVQPKVIPLTGQIKNEKVRQIERVAGKGKKNELPPILPSFTPGKNGIPLPEKVEAQGNTVLISHTQPVKALKPRFKDGATRAIKYLTVEQGLSASAILCMLFDTKGRLWYGTWEGGVGCYDGTYLTHFTVNEGLNDNRVYSMKEDSQGRIWFGTFGGGIACYDGEHLTRFTSDGGLLNDWVFAIEEDQDRNMWFGTVYGACQLILNASLDQGDNYFVHYTTKEGLSNNHIQSIILDDQNNLWFGTIAGGVSRFDGTTFYHYTTMEGLSNNDVRSIFQDQRSRIWFGTNGGGLNLLEGNTLTHLTVDDGLNNNTVMSITEDEQGHLYFGSLGGLNIWNGQRFISYQTEDGLMLNSVLDVAINNKTGQTWVGTDGGGLNLIFDQGQWHFINKGMTKAIVQDQKGNYWFGIYGGGLLKFDGQNLTGFQKENGLIGDQINELLVDQDDKIWITTNIGLSMFDGQNFTNYTTAQGLCFNILNSIYEDQKGTIWVASNGGGMSRFDGQSFTNYSIVPDLKFNIINQILEDNQGNLWLATNLGLVRFDGQNYTYFTTNEGLVDNNIAALFLDSNDHFWIGTAGGISLLKLSSSKSIEVIANYTTNQGLSHNNIRSFQEAPNGHIWAMTERGITIFSPEEKASPPNYQLTTYGNEGHLKNNFLERGNYLDANNHLWLGTKQSVTRIDLNSFNLPTAPPRNLTLSHIEIDQQFFSFRNLTDTAVLESELLRSFDSVARFYNYPLGLKLPHHRNHLTFHFSATDWQGPQSLQYSYLMEGMDKHWSPLSKENEADYRNLSPGQYTFKVKAIGAAQAWSDVFEYAFQIYPPWWQTWWAYVLYAFLAIFLLYILYQYQKKRWMLKISLEKEQEESMRLREIDEFKSRFYTNITHEFRTPLTVIRGLAGQIQENPRWKTTERLQMIEKNSDNVLRLINQLLDLSKLEAGKLKPDYIQGDVIQFLAYLIESYHSFAFAHKINLSFHAETRQVVMDYDPQKYQQVMENLLSNAIKFTPEYGKIKITAKALEHSGTKSLEIHVQDTGVGISEEKIPYIFDRFFQADNSSSRKAEGTGIGLALVKELVELMDGKIRVESKVNQGTTFYLQFPVHNEAPIEEATPDISTVINMPTPAYQTSGAIGDAEQPLILLVEDNIDVTYYLKACLDSQFQIVEARNGKKGLEKAIETIPDIVISDVMMPEMDGFELCQALKNDPITLHIPVILLTAKVTQEDKIEGLTQGADAYLTKPFQKEELLLRVNNLITTRKQLQERYWAEQTNKEENTKDPFLIQFEKIVNDSLEDPDLNVSQICRELGISRVQLHRKLKALTDFSTAQYIRLLRLNKAQELLKNTDLTISEIAYQTGFKDVSHFSRVFTQQFGERPSVTRK